MAQGLVDYLKEGYDSVVNSSENEKKKKAALKELEDFLNSYVVDNSLPDKPILDDVPPLDKMEYTAPTDEEIKKNAADELAEYKQGGIGSIDSEMENLKKQYESGLAAADKNLEKNNSAVEEAYSTAKKSTDNDLLKRGIARSSIAANKSAELEGAQAKMKSDVYNKYTEEVSGIDNQISGLETKRAKALDDFNITYAAKLTKSINDLKSDRQSKLDEVLKYNNTITEKQNQAQIDKTMKESDLYSEALSQREKENAIKGGGDSDAKQKQTYNKMAEALRGLNGIDARKMLAENNIFQTNLSSKYYYALLDEFAR